MRILLITPPLVQINTPYPATPYLTAFLKSRGFEASQADASLDLVLRLFSARGIRKLAAALPLQTMNDPPPVRWFRRNISRCAATIDGVISFLQGHNPALTDMILARGHLPEGPRFAVLAELTHHGRKAGLAPAHRILCDPVEKAKYLASLYIDDIADAIRLGIDPWFGLARYAEKLAAGLPDFEPLRAAVERRPTPLGRILDDLAEEYLCRFKPAVIGFTLPFPGTVYGALRMARRIKRLRPELPVILGGGYVNTELRSLKDPRLFDYCDFVTFDDGALPLLRIVQRLKARRAKPSLVRTMYRREKWIIRAAMVSSANICRRSLPPPTYADLKLKRYIDLVEMPNPMHSLWSNGRWNKFMLAHGCYWHRCRFCDTTLDYIRRYEEPDIDAVIDDMIAVVRATGFNGFHFVDEAASPGLLRKLAERLLARGIAVKWWTNIRFEKAFTPALTRLLARAGCIAVCGGLETACDRTLLLMRKGIECATAARVCRAFADAGIMVHAYLMYGFPTQTFRETISALNFVRRLFKTGALHAAYWHRFALTIHSPMHAAPAAHGVTLAPAPSYSFARNEASWIDPEIGLNDAIGKALQAATYNYMFGVGLERPAAAWFAGVRNPARRRRTWRYRNNH